MGGRFFEVFFEKSIAFPATWYYVAIFLTPPIEQKGE
jgi:hypothetical protein